MKPIKLQRETKKRDERLDEILNVAQKLFSSEGYDSVSVNQIITEIGIAKGTFYHYFKSKEDLLDGVVLRFTKQIINVLNPIAEDPNLNAVEKMNKLFIEGSVRKFSGQNLAFVKMIIAVMKNPANLPYVHKILQRSQEASLPIISKIIQQGAEEGVFKVTDYEGVSAMILGMGQVFNDRISNLIWEESSMQTKKEGLLAGIELYQTSMERILDAPNNSFNFFVQDMLKIFER